MQRDSLVGRLTLAALGALWMVSLCGIMVWSLIHFNDPPGNWRDPPLYPGAQNAAVQDFGQSGKRIPDRFNDYLVHLVTFSVANKPEDIKAFYEARYKGSWREGSAYVPAGDQYSLRYFWFGSGRFSAMYTVEIMIKPSGSAGTDVKIRSTEFPGY